MKYVVIGTAGHIDHGKTELVKALTGKDCDRFPEEKSRGITIDIGFASLDGPDVKLSFIDVPGHERFVKNMLAGVWGIDCVLLVVAADESVMPQTREHFDILNILGVDRGLVAVTKTDLVDTEMVELVELEVHDLLKGTAFDGAPVLPVSAKTGDGVPELKEALLAMAAEAGSRDSGGLFRLYVDRSFTIKGHGTVITGTVISGSVTEGEEVTLLPAGRKIRIRGIEVHDAKVQRATAGQRAALNLQGVEVADVSRGDQILGQGQYKTSYLLNVSLDLLASAERPLRNNERVRFHHGTSEILARVKLLDAALIPPGGSAFAQLRLETPTLCFFGDRFVVRRYSPMITAGGGAVLDGSPSKLRGSGRSQVGLLEKLQAGSLGERVTALCDRAGARGMAYRELLGRSGVLRDALDKTLRAGLEAGTLLMTATDPPHVFSAAAFEALKAKSRSVLEAFHRADPLRWGMSKEELREKVFGTTPPQASKFLMDRLGEAGILEIRGEEVRIKGREVRLSDAEQSMADLLETTWEQAGMNPPSLPEVIAARKLDAAEAERIFKHLQRSGRIVPIGGGIAFHRALIERLRRIVLERSKSAGKLEIGWFKEKTGTSRKYAIPLLEYMDRERWTRREPSGDRVILLNE